VIRAVGNSARTLALLVVLCLVALTAAAQGERSSGWTA